jgi:hypothetical protein
MGLVSVYQTDVYGDIYLTAKKEITEDAIGRVEEYDSQDSEDLADSLMMEAEAESEAAFDEQTEFEPAELEETQELHMASDADIEAAELELEDGNRGEDQHE